MYLIIEMIWEKEYKIAIESYRFVGPRMYMFLSDTYYLGNRDSGLEMHNEEQARRNSFSTYELAKKAVEELNEEE